MVALVMACLSASLGKTSLPTARASISSFDEIGSVHAICEQTNPLCRKPAQESTAGFIDRYDITQKEINSFTIRHRLVASGLDHFDVFAGDLAINRETRSFLAELFV